MDTLENKKQEPTIFTLKIQETPLQDQNLRNKILKYVQSQRSQDTYFKQSNTSTENQPVYSSTGNSFFDAFYAAYCLHGDVMISANDIWLVVSHQLSKVVNEDAEKYRDLFVSHEGKKELIIYLDGNSPSWANFPCQENRWDIAMEMFNEKIGEHTKGDVSLLMKNDFSSTNVVEKAAANICLMSQMQKYFEYKMILCGCGIQNVHFVGGVSDFEYLADKIENLKQKYPLNEYFKQYLEKVLNIVNTFVDQMKNPANVDLKFWNTIFEEEVVTKYGISGIRQGTQLGFKGWFVNFFGVDELKENRVPSFNSSTPVVAIDAIRNRTYDLVFKTDMIGIEEIKPNVFKPISNIYVTGQKISGDYDY